jgi:hypothetical protein
MREVFLAQTCRLGGTFSVSRTWVFAAALLVCIGGGCYAGEAEIPSLFDQHAFAPQDGFTPGANRPARAQQEIPSLFDQHAFAPQDGFTTGANRPARAQQSVKNVVPNSALQAYAQEVPQSARSAGAAEAAQALPQQVAQASAEPTSQATEAERRRKSSGRAQDDPDKNNETKKDSTPSEYSAFRENVATLSRGGLELSATAAYMKNNGFLQYDRSFMANAAARYGIMAGVELAVTVPYFYSNRSSQSGAPGQYIITDVNALGDSTAQMTALIFKETADYPAVNFTIGADLPTGPRPYAFGTTYTPGAVPMDPLYSRNTRGQWGAFSGLQFVKTYDPIVLYGGFSIDHAFDNSVMGHNIHWPNKWAYNFGLAFAVSEKTSLGFGVIGSLQPDMWVDGAKANASGSEPIIARVLVTQRIAPKIYIEPGVAFGLSKDAPNVVLQLGGRMIF